MQASNEATIDPTQTGSAQQFSREERIEQLRKIIGDANPSVHQLTQAIRKTTYLHYEKLVIPLAKKHWPEVMNDKFAKKMWFLSCKLYASAPYTMWFCAPKRPMLVRWVTKIANALPLPNVMLGWLARAAMFFIGRFAYGHVHKRIISVAAFVAVVDQAFDHCMEEYSPVDRGRKMHALLDGKEEPESESQALSVALFHLLSEGLTPDERVPYEKAVVRLKEWVDSEVAGMTGVEDESGLAHRVAGVKGVIEGLIIPLHDVVTPDIREWMYDVSMFIQMLDDWIDYDDDAKTERVTPVVSGHWRLADLETSWQKTVQGIEQLVRSAGLTSPHYINLIRDAYVFMLHETCDAMGGRIAD